MRFLAFVFVASLVAGAAPPARAASDVDGCDLVLTHQVAAFADIHHGDQWETYDTVEGVIDLTGEDAYGPGTYTVVWETGETETVTLDCVVPELPAQDPAEGDVCRWADEDEVIEGCVDVAPVIGVQGIASHVGTRYGRDYLALPEGPGQRVTICGPADCIERASTDAGPDRAMQRAGRVADLNAWDFERVCGCSASRGLVTVTVEYHGTVHLPPTDTGVRKT